MLRPSLFLLTAFFCLLSCQGPRNPGGPLAQTLQRLASSDPIEREDAFQQVLHSPSDLTPLLKPLAPMAPQFGCPVAAILYRLGEGDAVPLDVKARHFALFEWPEEYRQENALLEPYITHELENDLFAAGRPAIRYLAAVFRTSPRAEAVAGLMLRIHERTAVEFLVTHADLPAAQAALLPIAGTEKIREWWETAKLFDAEEWTRMRCRSHLQNDLDAFSREVGQAFPSRAEAEAWWRANESRRPFEWWKDRFPKASSSHFSPLYEALRNPSAPDAAAAHHLLEHWTGVHFTAFPAPDLPTRWRRTVENPVLHLRLCVLGPTGETDSWVQERIFPSVETAQAGGGKMMDSFDYALFVHVREQGTAALVGEFASDNEKTTGNTATLRFQDGLLLVYSSILRSYIAVSLEERPVRPLPEPPDAVRFSLLRLLRKRLPDPLAALALGYAEDLDSQPLLVKALRKDPGNAAIARALLLLDDPTGLIPGLTLPPEEREILDTRCANEEIRTFLQKP